MDGQWTNQDVKRANRSRVFRYFCEAGTSSLPEAARALGMSLPTVTQNVKALTESGLLQAGGSLDSTGGRRAKAFCLCARAHLSVGLSVTAGHLGGVLLDLQGQVLHTKRERLPFAPGEAYARAAAAFLDAFLKEAGAAGAPYGLGIALPGILDRTRGLLTRSHALGLRDVPLSALTAPFAQPCLLLNDANAGAFAEASGGGLPARFFYLSLSATVGGALVENGTPRRGDVFPLRGNRAHDHLSGREAVLLRQSRLPGRLLRGEGPLEEAAARGILCGAAKRRRARKEEVAVLCRSALDWRAQSPDAPGLPGRIWRRGWRVSAAVSAGDPGAGCGARPVCGPRPAFKLPVHEGGCGTRRGACRTRAVFIGSLKRDYLLYFG